MQSHDIHPGDVLAGKYRVRAILGRDHGLLVEAFHTEFDQRVVIKVLLPGAGDAKEIERFRREAKTLAKLSSEHAARIIDVGSEGDGTFYLVREHLEGTDMARYLRSHGPLALSDAVLLILQAAEAVAETHSHGIIVREIQPSTLFLTQRPGGAPLVKLIDFGTAKLMNAAAAPSAGAELTATAMFGLSPYSSPEMIRKAKSADGRADVWSLGAILYELLTGHPPFRGEAAMLMLQISREEPTPPSHLAPHLPPDIDQVIAWALAKDVDARFKNVYAFAHALRPFAPPEGQLLVDRIGQITEAARRKPKPASLPPPSAPPPRASQPAPPMRPSGGARPAEESFTKELVLPARGAASGGPDDAARAPGLGAPPPNVPTIPPPRPSSPASMGAPQPHAMGAPPMSAPPVSVPQPAPSGPGLAAPPSAVAANAPSARGSQPGYSSHDFGSGASPAYSTSPPNKPLLDRRLLVGAIAAVAVLLPAMVAILVMSRSKPAETETGSTAQVTATAPVSVPVPASAAEPVASAAQAPEPATTTASPATSATTSDPSTAPPSTQDPVASAKKTVTSAGGSPTTKSTATDPAPKTTTTKTADPPPSGGGSQGTLMAIALGGTCAFSVNGSSKGSGSSIRVQLAPGTYSVMCKPPGGALKSKSVTVKRGETAMATFKL